MYVKQGNDDTIQIWTVVDEDDFALREQVYQTEGTIYDDFPVAELDFHVLTLGRLGGRDLKTSIPNGFIRVSRRNKDAAES